MKIRLDELLVKKKLTTTRSKAKQLINAGHVLVNNIPCLKPGQLFEDVDHGTISLAQEDKYVSRGALKLERAIQNFKINPTGFIIADIGASTGGFTDYLLQHGASKIYAIDVGHNQLAPKLLADKRVVNMEGVNIRNGIKLEEKADLAVVDLSYISLRLTLPEIAKLLAPSGHIIALIKPQFESGPKVVGKDGVIKALEIVNKIVEELKIWCQENSLPITKIIPSPIQGKQGNHEFLALISPLQ